MDKKAVIPLRLIIGLVIIIAWGVAIWFVASGLKDVFISVFKIDAPTSVFIGLGVIATLLIFSKLRLPILKF